MGHTTEREGRVLHVPIAPLSPSPRMEACAHLRWRSCCCYRGRCGRSSDNGIVGLLGFDTEVDHRARVGFPFHLLGLPHLCNRPSSNLITVKNTWKESETRMTASVLNKVQTRKSLPYIWGIDTPQLKPDKYMFLFIAQLLSVVLVLRKEVIPKIGMGTVG